MRIITLIIVLFVCCLHTKAQLPELTASDNKSPIILKSLGIDVQVIGTRASTVFTMTFFNPADRVLEGTFLLSLPEGAEVTNYALDINGRMREAVPVEKAKATQVFESIEKRKVDPGLLERTEGNVFRTRIFPIPAKGQRTIIVGYEQELHINSASELVYFLPLSSNKDIPSVKININLPEGGNEPKMISTPLSSLHFQKKALSYAASAGGESERLAKPLSFSIPRSAEETTTVFQAREGSNYFLLQTFLPGAKREKKLPRDLTIIWDNSLSGLYRDRKKELSLLQAYLKLVGNTRVNLFTVNNTYKTAGSYEIINGNAEELINIISKLPYDGGSDFTRIQFSSSDEILLFSDGFSNLADCISLSSPSPLYTISSTSKSNFGFLKQIAEANGGSFINLSQIDQSEALASLKFQTFRFLGIKADKKLGEYYPSQPQAVSNGFSMVGKIEHDSTTVVLQFGYGKEVSLERTAVLTLADYDDEEINLKKLFARKKIAELDKAYETNEREILLLGKENGLVTRNTSLLVLEDIMDYVRNEIEPPAELLSDYKRLMGSNRQAVEENVENTLKDAISMTNDLWTWYNAKPKAPSQPRKEEVSQPRRMNVPVAAPSGSSQSNQSETVRARRITTTDTVAVRDGNDPNKIIQYQVLEGKADFAQALNGRAPGISVTMQESNAHLQEVVVTGYTVRRKDIPNISSSSQALIIVDGKKVSTIPPKEKIRSFELVQGAAATTAYGSEGLNGVYVITTINSPEKEEEEDEDEGGYINLQPKPSNSNYLKSLSLAPKESKYKVYLELREKNLLNPNFYYEVASYFLKSDKALGIQVLTNLAELDFQNHELQKLFAFKLKELGEKEMQLFILKKILLSRPQEPQSYRDFALALADNGLFQEALDTLYLSLTNKYKSDIMQSYRGIEETIVMELNNLIQKQKSSLDISKIEKKLLRQMPVDVRVVLGWNMNDTDMDLWVTDPNGEKCYYQSKHTRIGGRMSDDFTDGYGPEQFLLKNAIKGKYKIQVHYYGESGAKLAGNTTLMVEVFTNYGRANEKRKIITLQLKEEEREGIYVGEFEF